MLLRESALIAEFRTQMISPCRFPAARVSCAPGLKFVFPVRIKDVHEECLLQMTEMYQLRAYDYRRNSGFGGTIVRHT